MTDAIDLPLAGVRVLDLADDSGFMCGRTLADLGADVIKVEPPSGDPGRRVPPFAGDDPHVERSLAWLAGNVNKRGVTCDLETEAGRELFGRLVQQADVVVESFTPGYLDGLGLGYEELAAINPAIIMTSITPFGVDGPVATSPASDLEVTAASGSLWLAGDPQGPPVRTTLPQAPSWAGMSAAAGTLMAVLARNLNGRGQHVDVSSQAAMIAAISHAPMFWDLLKEEQNRSGPYLTGRSVTGAKFRMIWPCRDGYVAFALYGGPAGRATSKALMAWMEEKGGAPDAVREVNWDEFDVATCTPATVERIEAAIGPFLLTLSRAEFFQGVIARNMLGYPVATVEDIWKDEQLISRGMHQQVDPPWGGPSLPFPGTFVLFDGQRPPLRRTAPKLGEHNAEVFGELATSTAKSSNHTRASEQLGTRHSGLGGPSALGTSPRLRVVEFGGFAAGPVVGKHLASYGAEVIRVESKRALDGFRTHYPPFKENVPGIERAGIFSFFNDGKHSVTLNLKTDRGKELARALVSQADVVVENFTPGTISRLGLGYDVLSAANPGLVMLSTCNQGQTGPHAGHPGFGSHLTSLAGFTNLLGYAGETPVLLYGPYIDYIAVGYGLVAVLAALVRRGRTGQGSYIDLSQYETGVQFMTPALLDYFVNGRIPARQGNRHPTWAPHGVFPCAGEDRWCALSVAGDGEWLRFVEALDHPEWGVDPAFATQAGRKAEEDRLETLIAGWTRQHSREDVVERLRKRRLRVYPVNSMADLYSDTQLTHRGHWVPVEHPVQGPIHAQAPPFRLLGTPPKLGRPAPCLGADNGYVLGEILGLSSGDIEDLAHQGVLD